MSYGSTFVPFDAHGRISSKLSRPSFKKEHQERKLVQYEKEFDVNLSRIAEKQSSLRESMVAYSRKMRTIQDARISNSISGKNGDPLFVRAKHIPKYPVRAPRKRRPMSFDELLGRDRDVPRERPTAAKQRPHSDKIKPTRDGEKSGKENDLHLPMLNERLRKTGQNVHVSLVSASDLYELVDFSLRSKNTKSESLQMLRMEKDMEERSLNQRQRRLNNNSPVKHSVHEEGYGGYERTTDAYGSHTRENNKNTVFDSDPDNLIPTVDFYQETFSLTKTDAPYEESQRFSTVKLPAIQNDAFKRRPNRAKRMQLFDSGLGDIPEDNVLDMKNKSEGSNSFNFNRRVISPPPPKHSPRNVPRNLDIGSHSLDVIQEKGEKVNEKKKTEPLMNGYIKTEWDGISEEEDEDTPRSTSDDGKKDNKEESEYRSILPMIDNAKSMKKILIRDDGDVRIEVTQCPPKHETLNTKLKAQKRFKKLIYLRDAPR